MKPKALLWDLDDTLLNTLPGRMKALAHAYETVVGGSTDPLALWISHRGGTLEDLGRRLAGDDYQRFATVYRDRYYTLERNIVAYEGIEPVLEAFLEAEIPMAVVTSKVAWPRSSVDPVLRPRKPSISDPQRRDRRTRDLPRQRYRQHASRSERRT